jgi:hypothetical protein
MTQFITTLLDPFISGRGDTSASSPNATPFAEEDDAARAYAVADGKRRSGAERDAYGMITKAVPSNPVFDPRWSVWAAGFGGSQTTDGNAALGSNDTTSRVFGVAAGADYLFSPRTIAGFALAGGGTQFSVANGSTGRSDLFQAGAFVKHRVGPAYVAGALAYGWQDITTDRTVTIAGVDRLHAQFNANAFSGRVEGGYRFATPWMGITPYAAGQFTTFDLPAYAEQALSGANTFALAYGSKSVTASRSDWPAHRQLLGDAKRDPDLARALRLGARLQRRPQYRSHLPDAAGRVIRRQRRGAGARLSPHHRFHRDEMAERLVCRGDFRGRVLRRQPLLYHISLIRTHEPTGVIRWT